MSDKTQPSTLDPSALDPARLDPAFPYKAIAFDPGFLGAEPASFDSEEKGGT